MAMTGRRGSLLAQRVDDTQAIQSRQQDIRNHEVRGLGCRHRERGFTVRDGSKA
jgi:hypothetical protein